MKGQKKQIILLASTMVLLIAGLLLFNSYYMYVTSLDEQKERLTDIVESQKNILAEIGVRLWTEGQTNESALVNILVRAHSLFMQKRSLVEFTVAHKEENSIAFLIVNGKKVKPEDAFATLPLNGTRAVPMRKALSKTTGTIIGKDYDNQKVLAAFTYVEIGDDTIGLVAKMDIDSLKRPFIQANVIALVLGAVLTLFCIWLFFKISDPILRNLQQSEKKYRDLVENADSIILRVDTNGYISFANQFANKYFTGSKNTLIGMRPLQLFEDPIENDSLQDLNNYLKKKTGLNPSSVRTNDGNVGWVSWKTKLFEDDIQEMLCIGTDVTNEYLAKEAQKEIQERFRALTKAAPVGIIITETQGKLIYANEMMHNLTGVSTTELAGNGWMNYVEASMRSHLQQAWFTDKKYDKHFEFRLSANDDTLHWVLGQSVLLHNVHGLPIGNLITLTDITHIKEIEKTQNRLTAAIEQAAEMIIITDADGTITYVNPAFVKTSGYSKKETLGQNPKILKSNQHDKNFYKELWKELTDGNVWTGRFINKKRMGNCIHRSPLLGLSEMIRMNASDMLALPATYPNRSSWSLDYINHKSWNQ